MAIEGNPIGHLGHVVGADFGDTALVGDECCVVAHTCIGHVDGLFGLPEVLACFPIVFTALFRAVAVLFVAGTLLPAFLGPRITVSFAGAFVCGTVAVVCGHFVTPITVGHALGSGERRG